MENPKPSISLGTAQFGIPYGITNSTGQVSKENVRQILSVAQSSTVINYLDTAQSYGESESVLGDSLPCEHDFSIITKLSAQPKNSFSFDDVLKWENSLIRSFQFLKVNSIDSLLLHSSNDLHKTGSQFLEDWLLSLKERGLVKRIGISIYTANELQGVHSDLIDIVQLPLSLYDQRLLLDGTIGFLKSRGISIHARSLFLQGLLVTPEQQWPHWISENCRKHHKHLELRASKLQYGLLELALGFAKSQKELEAIVIGITSLKELEVLLRTWYLKSPFCLSELSKWALPNSEFLDPRNWPS